MASRASEEDAAEVAVGDRRRKAQAGPSQMIAVNKMPVNEAYAELAMNNSEALVAKGYADAYIGFTVGNGPAVAVYDYDKCVEMLCESKGIEEEEAVEFLNFTVVFSHFGKHSPMFVQLTNVRK